MVSKCICRSTNQFVGLLIILFLASIFDEAEFISAIASLVIGTAIYAILIAASTQGTIGNDVFLVIDKRKGTFQINRSTYSIKEVYESSEDSLRVKFAGHVYDEFENQEFTKIN